MRPGALSSISGVVRKPLDQRGVIQLELVISCIVLLLFFFATVEAWSIIHDKIQLERIVRDATREAALMGDVSSGQAVGQDRAQQYFGTNASRVHITLSASGDFVTGRAEYKHPVFGNLRGDNGVAEVKLSAQAMFYWKDQTDL